MNANNITRLSTLAAAIALTFSASAWAVETMNQTIEYEVPSISLISIAAGTPSIATTLANFTVGATGDVRSPDATSSYAITTTVESGKTRKITAKISTESADLPADVELFVKMTAPGSGSSIGDVSLTTSDQDVVTGIGNASASGVGITYYLTAPVAAGAFSGSANVIYTLTDAS